MSTEKPNLAPIIASFEARKAAAEAATIQNATRPAIQPLRQAYSRQELTEALNAWMIELWGSSPKDLDPDQRERFHRDSGLIHHFITDHFPNTTP